MTLKKQMKRHLGKKTTKRIYTAMPWVGGALAVAAAAVWQNGGLRSLREEVSGSRPTRRENAPTSTRPFEHEEPLVGRR
jgi:hypothetical protein